MNTPDEEIVDIGLLGKKVEFDLGLSGRQRSEVLKDNHATVLVKIDGGVEILRHKIKHKVTQV